VSTGSRWVVDGECLDRVMSEWRESMPDEQTKNRVHDRLIDLSQDPLGLGREEPGHPGILWVRVLGTGIGVLFTVDIDEMSICVVSVYDAD
jgi:hypothetical protein